MCVCLSIYLQDHGVELPGGVECLGTGQDGAGLASTRRTIEQEVGQSVLSHEPPNCSSGAGEEEINSYFLRHNISCLHLYDLVSVV